MPSIAVMERAAQALADAISGELPEGAAVYFACGTGGNGGDGTACARLLCGRYRCTIVQPRPPRHPEMCIRDSHMPAYLSWLENPVHTRSVIGSNPIAGTTIVLTRVSCW